jgi:hypothetical protein
VAKINGIYIFDCVFPHSLFLIELRFEEGNEGYTNEPAMYLFGFPFSE